MKKIIISSLERDAGKTGVLLGIAANCTKPFSYIKPFGDHLVYHEKKIWDPDAHLMKTVFDLEGTVEEMSLGFDHSKLRFKYDEAGIRQVVREMAHRYSAGKSVLFVEAGRDLARGYSVHLDAVSLTQTLDGDLILVASGNHDRILDDVLYFHRHGCNEDFRLAGIILNKVKDADLFRENGLKELESSGVNVLGIIPFDPRLTHPTVRMISETLSAKVLSAEDSLNMEVHDIFVGAMSADAVLRLEKFKRRQKLIITSGDRSDMILAAINADCVGIVLTNNILPPPNIIARASEKKVPLMLVQSDTFQIAKKIDLMTPLTSPEDTDRIGILQELAYRYIDLNRILGPENN